MRTAFAISILFALSTPCRAADPETLLVWPQGAPGAVAAEEVDRPTLAIYQPPAEGRQRAAIVVCPGGGYSGLAMDHEGQQIADWLNAHGVTACVLKYRLGPRYHHPAPLSDAQRAIRIVRAQASELEIDPDKIGILGFSAGGHLASTAATHFDRGQSDAQDPIDRQSCRPDFAVLLYPVIALATEYAHAGSLKNLLGDAPDAKLLESLSNERQVTAETPPCFLVHTNEDKPVPAENSVLFYLALRKAGVPAEMHIYEFGRHGLGLGKVDPAFSTWPALCIQWMTRHGWLAAPEPNRAR
ncbi:MAG: alpha/beta hydrolase [Pirellulales bacterium]|nr:alpha/beta hydrolase [Pirellulales bacterium]